MKLEFGNLRCIIFVKDECIKILFLEMRKLDYALKNGGNKKILEEKRVIIKSKLVRFRSERRNIWNEMIQKPYREEKFSSPHLPLALF